MKRSPAAERDGELAARCAGGTGFSAIRLTGAGVDLGQFEGKLLVNPGDDLHRQGLAGAADISRHLVLAGGQIDQQVGTIGPMSSTGLPPALTILKCEGTV